MVYQVNIITDNAAFHEYDGDTGHNEHRPDLEIVRILRELANQVELHGTEGPKTLRDVNGNNVGRAQWVKRLVKRS